MAKITLNGNEIEVEDGLNLVQAAATVGIEIPHYCYHPGLKVDGNCRMCLVEVDGARGPQIACNTWVKDGLVARTNTPAVEKMRRGVMEFLLLNHPIDCPVCDQAGECRLQDYYMSYAKYDNRSEEKKVKKAKAVDIGPLVMLDQERCILCSRCVRFTQEISKTHELMIINRGDRARITTFPGKELDNPYSGNVIDICPVGALTSKDFRFKQRVWFLKSNKSVCTGCSRGCNIFADYNKNKVYRYRPRFNDHVNDYWMCDDGRMSYKLITENRLLTPRVDGNVAPARSALTTMAERLAQVLKSDGAAAIAAVGSPLSTVEDNFVLKRFMGDFVKGLNLWGASLKPFGYEDDFLIRADKTPNRAGVQFLGLNEDAESLLATLENGKIKLLIVLNNNLAGDGGERWKQAIAKVPNVFYIGTHDDETAAMASIAYPAVMHVERNGTYLNVDRRLQKVTAAFDPGADALPEWEVLSKLSSLNGGGVDYLDIEAIWRDLRTSYPVLGDMTFYKIPEDGIDLAPRPDEQQRERVEASS